MNQLMHVLPEITATRFLFALVCSFFVLVCSVPISPWLGLGILAFLAFWWVGRLNHKAEQKWSHNVFGENAYQILGVPWGADTPVIRAAFRKLEREHHPDAVPEGRKAEATRAFDRINKAYELLTDREKRFQYDGLLKEWQPRIPPFEAAYDQIKNEDKHPMYEAYDNWLADRREPVKGSQDQLGEGEPVAAPGNLDREADRVPSDARSNTPAIQVESESAAAEVEIPESIREAMGLPVPDDKKQK